MLAIKSRGGLSISLVVSRCAFIHSTLDSCVGEVVFFDDVQAGDIVAVPFGGIMVVSTRRTRIIGTSSAASVHSWSTSKDVVAVSTEGAEVDFTNGGGSVPAPSVTQSREREIK